MIKNILILALFLTIGCSSDAQRKIHHFSKQSYIELNNGIIVSVDSVNIAKYEISVEDIDIELSSFTLEHLLCIAAEECDKELLEELIKKKVNVNSNICEGDQVITYLAYCKENGVALTELMLQNGANINGADQDNDSFLSYAISYDNLKLVEYLIANGANPTQRDINKNMGCLPIHGCESLEMLKKLETAGFEINVTCDNGRNLLHFAARENFKEIAQYLVNNKLVNIDQKDKNGETPLDYANKANNLEIVKIITNKK